MTMPHQRLQAFLWAGELLWRVAHTSEHTRRWGAELPELFVNEAKRALRHYPSSLEMTSAADDQRSMNTWMAREARSQELQRGAFARLRAAFAEVDEETATDGPAFGREGFVDEWLATEHPALGYREPFRLLAVTSNTDMLVELLKTEWSVSCEARRVFQSEILAYRWLREVNRWLGAIPLEMLGSDAGRLRVINELRHLAAEMATYK